LELVKDGGRKRRRKPEKKKGPFHTTPVGPRAYAAEGEWEGGLGE